MEVSRIRFQEHLSIECPLSLEDFCSVMKQEFGFPDFEFDCENQTEWGFVEYKDIEYNVSRPYERGTLADWDNSLPANCNFGISISVSNECPIEQNIDWGSEKLALVVGQALADLFETPVYHHRTWVGAGNNILRNKNFYPRSIKVDSRNL
jgi:hypothetical protein